MSQFSQAPIPDSIPSDSTHWIQYSKNYVTIIVLFLFPGCMWGHIFFKRPVWLGMNLGRAPYQVQPQVNLARWLTCLPQISVYFKLKTHFSSDKHNSLCPHVEYVSTTTVFLRSDAAVTIFSLFVLALLFKSGYYSRATFILLGSRQQLLVHACVRREN